MSPGAGLNSVEPGACAVQQLQQTGRPVVREQSRTEPTPEHGECPPRDPIVSGFNLRDSCGAGDTTFGWRCGGAGGPRSGAALRGFNANGSRLANAANGIIVRLDMRDLRPELRVEPVLVLRSCCFKSGPGSVFVFLQEPHKELIKSIDSK